VKSKRFAPEAGSLAGKELDQANNGELLRRLRGADASRRRASYVCVAVLLRRPNAVPESFAGRCWGRVLDEPKGTGGFGYDPLFFHEGLGKTFAELTVEEKNAVSHRGEAFRQLAATLVSKPL
ncbi:MAG: non-canonical purine NTP pyrophosphatase, partial [Gemmatimonadales bacterium]|nr:non-canonical purine NTP pyrophosphatase [Gemmatimonadales bacterium]